MTEHRPSQGARRALGALLSTIALLAVGAALWPDARQALGAPEAAEGVGHERPRDAAPIAPSRSAPSPADATDAEARPGAVDPGSLPFDLGAIMEQVHFAYRESDAPGRYAGGHTTYAVEIDPTVATLRAYHALADGAEVRESAPLRLSVSQLGRGEREVRSGETRIEGDGHLALARGEAVEHYRNRDEGVEQSWSFERKPSGEGDLVVRVAARGLEYRGATESGLHFADASGLGFRYGHGTWIDAAGRETHVRARWARGAIELAVPADVLEASAYPAVLDPIISPEFGMDEPVVGAADGSQSSPSVASNGSGYLVVWADPRSGSADLYGALVASDGTVQSPTGLAVSTAANDQRTPSVASNGTGYLVVWEDQRSGPTGDIYGTLVASDGTVQSPSGVAVSTAASSQLSPSVASSGSGYLVVWQDIRSGSTWDIYGTLVASDGTVQSPSGVAVSTAASNQRAPSVASNGSGYLVVWEDTRSGSTADIYGTLVRSDGVVQSPSGVAVSTAANEQSSPSVGSNGSGYLAVWEDRRSASSLDIYGTLVRSDGVVQSPSGVAVSVAANEQSSPSVGSNGSGYLVVWQDARTSSAWDLYGTLVASDGTVASPSGIAVSTAANNQEVPSLASNGSGYLVVWQDQRGGPARDIYGTSVASDGTVESPTGLLVSAAANSQRAPSVASSGSEYLVVWQDFRAGSMSDIYGVLIASDGTVQTPSGVAVSTAASVQQLPSVASNGSGYLVAWEDTRSGSWDIYTTLVGSDGAVQSPSGVAVSTGASAERIPSVASNGSGYLLVWQDHRGASWDIYGTLVGNDGTVQSPGGVAVSTAANPQLTASVASDGDGYLVVWQDIRSGSTYDIYGTLVGSDGTVESPTGVPVSTASGYQSSPSVASSGSDYLVVWEDQRNGQLDIYGTLVAGDGTVQSPSGLPISMAGLAQRAPTVAAHGSDYFVAWEDVRGGSTYDVYGTRVRSGVVESPSGIALAADVATNESAPSLAAGPEGAFFLAYDRFVPDAPLGAVRARARLIRYGSEDGDACATDTECESGFCTDGVCCSSRCGGGALDCQACAVAAGAAADGTCGPTTGNACSDGLGCTSGDSCSAGTCSGGGASPCTSGTSCSEAGGGAFECSACPAGTFSADGTGATACTPCASGTWSSAGATSCAAWTVCAAGAYVTSEGTPTSDRACSACASGTYSTTTNATSCSAWSTCAAGTYVSTVGTDSSDRECASCATGTYSSTANASSCIAWTACTASEYESVAATATSDRVCSALTVCGASEYESVAPTATSDRVCAPLTVCGASQYESVPATATSDRVCTALTVCSASEYESVPATATSDRMCTALTVCGASEYESTPATTTSDRGCTALTACSAMQYESVPPTATSDRVCTALTVCSASEYESTPASATSDRMCTSLTVCTATEFETVPPTATSDRVCAPLGACAAGEYESAPPTPTSDRVCSPLTACTADEYQSTPPTTTSDRVCTTLSVCTSEEFESVAPTAITDRVCTALTMCTSEEYESAAPTATSDRACTALTACAEGEYESTPPTATSDRVCTALTACVEGEYESAAPSATTDRECTSCTLCGEGTFEVSACTATEDAVCEPIGDGGMPDGGVLDGGADDGGVEGDGGFESDASIPTGDASVDPRPAAGCGCVAAGAGPRSSGPLAWAGLLALGLIVAARRRARG